MDANTCGSTEDRSPWIGFSAVSVGTFMATLDGSIVNVALPTMTRELKASLAGVQWIVAAYLLVISAALLTAGRLGDLWGHRRVYVGGLLLFTLGSLLCGLAPELHALVAARALQALGACSMMAMSPAIITALFPASQRGRALGAIASVVALGLTAGPPLGGLIVQGLSWRWIFFVNLPVGVGGAVWALRTLPAARPLRPPPLDRLGAFLLAVVLGAGVGAIQVAADSGWKAGLLGALSGCAAALVVGHLRRASSPILDPALFQSRTFAAGIAAGLLSYAALFTSTFLTPFFLSRVKALDARGLGAMLTSVPLALSLSSPLAGWLSDRFGPRALGPLGMLVLAAGLSAVGLAGPETTLPSFAARLAVCGTGMGLFQPPNNSAVMGMLPRSRLGTGGGMLATARNLGMVLGIALATALFRARAGRATSSTDFLSGYRPALLMGAGLALTAALVSLARDRSGTGGAAASAPPA